jgi:hypothetical protein
MDEEKLRELAVRWVCPLSGNPQDSYEKRMVDQLIRFGHAVLQAAQQSAQTDGAICPDCHEPLVNGVCPALAALQDTPRR